MSEPAKKVPVTTVTSQSAKISGQVSNPFHPWQPFESLRRQIDSLFDEFSRAPLWLPFSHSLFDAEQFRRRDSRIPV
ncbi:hypothetical protein ACAW63_16885 [Pseudomonas sp. QE6]|uniref:hypothetical protein n=1 Tax=Pseudomonas sp. QE6 TaxID=3242491 RepID=UPI003527FD2F